MTEDDVRLEARLAAIEYMIANVYTLLHRLFGSPHDAILRTHKMARDMLSKQALPGVDAAQSDMFVAEVQDAVERMLRMIEEMTGIRKRREG